MTNTDHQAINTWMRGNGWEWIPQEKCWRKVVNGFIKFADQDLAAEMWRMSEGRVAEARVDTVKKMLAKLTISKLSDAEAESIHNYLEKLKDHMSAHQPKETKDNE